jgi:hypothetical protein
MPEKTETVILHRVTLWNLIEGGGLGGMRVFGLTAAVLLWGIVMLFLPVTARFRLVYGFAALVPLALSLAVSALGMIKAFSVLGISGVGESSKLFQALAEISFPVQCALFGAALAYIIAAFAFLRKPRQSGR